MKGSFADKIRKTMRKIGASGVEITANAVFDELGIALPKTKAPAYRTFQDLKKAGEIESVSRGVYRWRGKPGRKSEIREVMWRNLRTLRTVTIEDLMELAGAQESYVKEWLSMLVRREIIQKLENSKYRLIRDTVEMPENTEKAKRLREIRCRKKAALHALAKAQKALDDARIVVEGM